MKEFAQIVFTLLSIVGWYIIIFYYTPYWVTRAIRKAKQDTPQHTETVVNLNMKDGK